MSLGFQLKQYFGHAAREAMANHESSQSVLFQELGNVADINAKMLRESVTVESMREVLMDHLAFAEEFHDAGVIQSVRTTVENVLQQLVAAESHRAG